MKIQISSRMAAYLESSLESLPPPLVASRRHECFVGSLAVMIGHLPDFAHAYGSFHELTRPQADGSGASQVHSQPWGKLFFTPL